MASPEPEPNKKRPSSPAFIQNPFIKKRNLQWTLESPSPKHSIDAQPLSDKSTSSNTFLPLPPPNPTLPPSHAPAPSPSSGPSPPPNPPTAAVEVGAVKVRDHLSYFSSHLSKHVLSPSPLSISSYAALYSANAGSSHGAHFVIHQHDHPIAGPHYDLRLQINETSSVSWAVMYGLPGDPNSVRLNRNATETRVHTLWNHLIETASSATGSLLIWDTGTYSILPRQSKYAPPTDPSSPASSPTPDASSKPQDLLHAAFQNRKIRVQLHGTKLPHPYVLNLRLTKSEDAAGRAKGTRTPKRRRGLRSKGPHSGAKSGGSDNEDGSDAQHEAAETTKDVSAWGRETEELENDEIRRSNAYTGASNSINSIHGRTWYLSLDRHACGFSERKHPGHKPTWEPVTIEEDADLTGGEPPTHRRHADSASAPMSFPFYVRGPDEERSIVTGRCADDLMQDEGVVNFTRRKGWVPVLN